MLLSAERSVLLLLDLQQRLMPAIDDGDSVVARAALLAEAALLLDVPVVATEQYPAGLGPTVGPSPAGYCSVATTGTSSSSAASASRAALATTRSPSRMTGISRCCRSRRSSTDRSADRSMPGP